MCCGTRPEPSCHPFSWREGLVLAKLPEISDGAVQADPLFRRGEDWARELEIEDLEATTALRSCTYAGRPYGSQRLVQEMAQRFGRCWTRGRPKKEEKKEEADAVAAGERANQFALF
jgi:hypothetical protein